VERNSGRPNVGDPGFEDRDFEESCDHCPSGCPGLNRVVEGRAVAMDGSLRLAALRVESGSSTGDSGESFWNQGIFVRPPNYSKDEWLDGWAQEGWLVRSHGKSRSRCFHPIHKSVPIDPQLLTGERVTIGFGPTGTRVVHEDRWTNPPRNLFDPKQPWRGWSLLRLKEPQESRLGRQFDFSEMKEEIQAAENEEKESSVASNEMKPNLGAGSEEIAPRRWKRTTSMSASSTSGGQSPWIEGDRVGYACGGAASRGKVVMKGLASSMISELSDEDEWEQVSEELEKVD